MSSNICSTARAADVSSLAPAGEAPTAGILEQLPMVPNLLHSIANNARWNIARNFDLADLQGQHEVNSAAHRLLIGGEAADDLLRARFHKRQGSVSLHSFRDPSGGFRRACAAVTRDGRGGNHAPGHCLPVREMGVSSCRFQRMSDSMAKIQDASEIRFF